MQAGHIMERSHFTPHYTRMLWVVFLTFLLSLPSFSFAQTPHLRVAVSSLDSGMVINHVQSGLQLELSRQGYVTGTNLTWVDNNKSQVSDIDMTISMAQNTPFITLVSQHGLSTEINLDEEHLDEERSHSHSIEHYEVNFIKKLLPGINTLGVILDKNTTDISNVKQFLAEQEHKGVRIISYYINSSKDLRATTRALAPLVDAIYLPFHITDMPELHHVVTVAERNNVALIGEDHQSVDKGVFAVYSIDYIQVGRDTADLLVRLAEGSGELHTDNYFAQPVLSINLDAAARMGVELSNEVIDKAKYIIE